MCGITARDNSVPTDRPKPDCQVTNESLKATYRILAIDSPMCGTYAKNIRTDSPNRGVPPRVHNGNPG